MLRRTKIVATLGPSTDNPETLKGIIDAGLDVARINFSHGVAEDHRGRARLLRKCAAEVGRQVGLLADLQGPKIRIEEFESGQITLQEGAKFTLSARLGATEGNEHQVGITYKELPRDVAIGDTLLLDDGNIVLHVSRVTDSQVETLVETGGVISNYKGINRLGGGLSASALTEKDHADVRLAAEMEVDYLAVSFPRNAVDLHVARELYRAAGGKGGICAKIERTEAIQELDEIIKAADCVMIARGDLGVELGDAELPGIQKRIISSSRALNCVVITATQMMQSMVESPQPTRAEVLDVANSVMDGTDAVMLSAETAIGRHPVKVVEAMDRICRGAERHHSTLVSRHRLESKFENTEEAIAMASMYTANHFNVAAILALTESGATAKWMSRISSGIPIYAMTRHVATQRRVTLYRGVYPINFDVDSEDEAPVDEEIVRELLRRGAVRGGDRIVITKGDLTGVSGGTNVMKIVRAV
ncbi:MAG: pyruvate kinase [Gammaproteobacteria bacterium]|nr:pyruvate kinase [Gammaproteobacteria bacterium]